MHLTLLTMGTRGDVQPYVALGVGLKAAGHTVRLATHTIYADLAAQHGLEFAPVEGNPQELMQGDKGQAFTGSSRNPLALIRAMRDIAGDTFEGIMRDTLAACVGTDGLVFSMLGFLSAYSVVEKLGLPAVGGYLQPLNPTQDFPMSPFADLPVRFPLHRAYNRLSYAIGFRLNSMMFVPAINQVRAEMLDMPPMPLPFEKLIKRPFPIVYGFSRHVVPRPADWPASVHLSGYWFLNEDAAWQPPADLADFLAAGPPPVYIGFGSISHGDAAETTAIVLEALARTGQRGLLLKGWGGLTGRDLPEHVFEIEAAPHDWLFPRMGAVVHHAGAGTTAAALRAGVPAVAVPIFADQPFWASRIAALGVGPAPIQRKRLTVDRLAYAIRVAVENQGMRARAAALGEKLRAEDGIGEAVRLIETILMKG